MAPPKPDDFPVTLTREEMLAEEKSAEGCVICSYRLYSGCGGMGINICFYRLSDRIYGYRYRFSGGFRHAAGKRIRPVFGIIGATLALLSCVLGDFFSIIGYIAKDYDMSYTGVLFGADYAEIFSLMTENLASMTILFFMDLLFMRDINSHSVHRISPRVVRFEF